MNTTAGRTSVWRILQLIGDCIEKTTSPIKKILKDT